MGSSISGALPFASSLNKSVCQKKFLTRQVSLSSIKKLCAELDPLSLQSNSLKTLLMGSRVTTGSKKYIKQELSRVVAIKKTTYHKGLLLSFPFKCKVPIKTNYHVVPDLGECMFMYRLGRLCRSGSLKLSVAEETEALAIVFGASPTECLYFKKKLKEFRDLLGFKRELEFISLSSLLDVNLNKYKRKLLLRADQIEKRKDQYKEELKKILPSIALSIPTNKLTLEESRRLIRSFFSERNSRLKKKLLFKTAYKYLAFMEIQRDAVDGKFFSQYLRLSICPKKGRIGIRPTIKEVRLLPHHGVPIVYINNGKKRFNIEYYFDFIIDAKNMIVTEVTDTECNFLYYEAIC